MKRIAGFAVLICLIPGCSVQRNLQEDTPAAPPKASAPVATNVSDEKNAAAASTVAIDGKTHHTSGRGRVTVNSDSDGATVIINGKTYHSNNGASLTGNNLTRLEKRVTPAFHKIELDGAYNLSVSCHEDASLNINAEGNLLPFIKTEVRGDTLHIYSERSLNFHISPTVRISAPMISALTVNGSCNSEVYNVSGDGMTLEINGSGDSKILGRVQNFKAQISGSGSVAANDLIAEAVNVEINGSGNADVHAEKTLTASVSGSGNISYTGNPTVRQDISGSGKIEKR